MELPGAGTDRHRPEPGAAAGAAAGTGIRRPRFAAGIGIRPGGRGGGPHRAAAGERWQPGHQEPVQGHPGLLSGVRRRRQSLARRPAFLPGRRRDHLLRRHRDGRFHRPARRRHLRRHGDLRRRRERDLHAGHGRSEIQRVDCLLGNVGDAGRRAAVPGFAPVLPAGLPARHRLPDEVRLQPGAGLPAARAPRRSRAGCPGWWTSRMPARRCTSPPRSSISTSSRRPPGRPGSTRGSVRRTPRPERGSRSTGRASTPSSRAFAGADAGRDCSAAGRPTGPA